MKKRYCFLNLSWRNATSYAHDIAVDRYTAAVERVHSISTISIHRKYSIRFISICE